MSISAINNASQTSFTSKIKTTKNGNQYDKTNAGKKILTGLTAGAWVAGSALVGRLGGAGFITTLTGFSYLAIPAMASSFLTGAIIDGIINKHARKSADKVAKLNAQA